MTEDTRWSAGEEAPVSLPRRRVGPIVAIAAAAVVGLVALVRLWTTEPAPAATGEAPLEVKADGYVSSHACRECHPSQHQSWHASYHRTMTQVASPESVIGRFDGTDVPWDGGLISFHRRGDEYWVRVAHEATPEAEERRVVLTTGSHHQQIYWVLTGQDRQLAMVPFAYLKDDQRWVPEQATTIVPPDSVLHSGLGRWNERCIACHTTHGVPGVQGKRVQSRVAEFGIACEACHGPGEAHVRFHQGDRTAEADASLVQPEYLTYRRASQVCGQCHSVFNPQQSADEINTRGFDYRPGDDLFQTQAIGPNPEKEDQFWSDGMVRVSGREFNGLIASPCYQRGEMSCLSCHVMHKPEDDPRPLSQWANDQLRSGMDGNRACLQCHREFEPEERLTAHTHHAVGSSGSLCYNCHMPHTTYGLLKAIRSHEIDSPDVKVSVKVGRPNACNLCHLDKTLSWTAGHLQAWHGIEPPELTPRQRDTSAALLWLLAGDAGQRALAAWHMGWPPAQEASGTEWIAPFLAELLDDPYDAVRYVSKRSLLRLPGFEDVSYDYVGSHEHRAQARQQTLRRWRKKPKTSLPFPDTVLIDQEGRLRRNGLLELIRMRPNRPMRLNE